MLRGARVAVIDAVMTTGATLNECARVLCEAEDAASVGAVVSVRQPWFSDARTEVTSAMRARHLTISGGQV